MVHQILWNYCTAVQTKSGRSLQPMFPSSASATIRRQVMLHVVKRLSHFADTYSYKGTVLYVTIVA